MPSPTSQSAPLAGPPTGSPDGQPAGSGAAADGTRGRSGRTRQKRGEGQWALGYHEPLNQNEQSKKDDNPLHVRGRIENIYSKRGFASIDGADLRGRFRWFGLYTQRRPGLDGGKTGALEPEELDDEYFMLRVRIDGGQLSTEQLRTIGEISSTYARGTADVTDRQNVQLHWIRIEDVPAIWERLEKVGLDTMEACGDSPRVILGSPLAGIAADEIIDGTPAIEEIKRRYIGNPEYANLPRKFKTSISGHPSQDVAPEVDDVSFVGTTHPELGPGFDVWVGGGLSTNPMLAQKMGVWVPVDDVADVWEGVVAIFRDYGYRRLRSRARLKFLVADWGVDKFREVLETEYLKRRLVDCASPGAPTVTGDHVGVHRQKDGRCFVGIAPTVGRVDGASLVRLADIAEAHGSGRVRTTPYQKLVVLDVEPDRVDSLVTALDGIGLSSRPSSWRKNTMACTGIEFCKLAIVETKQRATDLVAELERRFPDLDTPITVNVNGCPNACARTQVADIGLKGQLVLDADGAQVEGYQVHLGGALGLNPTFGKKLRAHKVTSTGLDDYITNVVTAFLDQREGDESFAAWVARADDTALRGEAGARVLEAAR
jgi:sulfite reductase (ferredoxin)